MTALDAVVLCVSGVAFALGAVRWLRVAQREHYLPGAVVLFTRRWWAKDAMHVALALVALGGAIASGFAVASGLVAAAVVAGGPIGLGLRGRTAKLAWTRRLRTVGGIAGAEVALATVIAGLAGGLGAAAVVMTVCAVVVPVVVEIALVIDKPIEDLLARRYVDRATERLRRVAPVVVAITGSYGKTSTKRFVEHVVSGSRSIAVSPRSFNNRAGLARAINETLALGTEVFVAEVGTYGPGEIAKLVSWLRPSISAITAIGPVHLERFGSLERTLAAKAEILTGAEVAVLNGDDERLAWFARSADANVRFVRCSASERTADVAVVANGALAEVFVDGSLTGAFATDIRRPLPLSNVAVAIALALALDVPIDSIVARLASLPEVDHRLAVAEAPSGVVVVDDTYNSNPAGVELALSALGANANDGSRLVVVTPGMVELGASQRDENAEFAKSAARMGAELVVVGTTNRRSLLEGYNSAESGGRAVEVGRREDAVAWVRRELGPGDVVLYENDLPDHYP